MDGTLDLTLGSGACRRLLTDAPSLLARYVEDEGRRYLGYRPTTPPDRLVPEDLAVTLLINSRAGYRAFKSLQELGPALDLGTLPDTPLEDADPAMRAQVSEVVANVAGWPGFATSLATKVLHKKRPALIPVLDNQAIFGAYLNATWPARPSSRDSIWSASRISAAMETIAADLTRPENAVVWTVLQGLEPARTRVELFDMVWWVHFRDLEPVTGPGSPGFGPGF